MKVDENPENVLGLWVLLQHVLFFSFPGRLKIKLGKKYLTSYAMVLTPQARS